MAATYMVIVDARRVVGEAVHIPHSFLNLVGRDKAKGVYDGSPITSKLRGSPALHLCGSFRPFGRQKDNRSKESSGKSNGSAQRSRTLRWLGHLQDLPRGSLQSF